MSDLTAFDLQPGDTVGGYVLLSRLGSGAMGSVWKVRDDGGQVYAMKMLRDSLGEDGSPDGRSREEITARERLRREAMALRRVNHPGVCGIVDMELDDALAFIITEFIEGNNLRQDVAANGRYVGDDLERLAGKLIDAVQAVHAAGIVHRDIKPTNVMIAASGPKLVDFGIAMGEGENHVTRTGLVMGTPGFIAPEIIEGEESTEATDWWSVASVLGFAATGRPVFGVKPMMTVLEREASGNADLSGLPPTTMRAIKAALDPDPRRRISPNDLVQAITTDALDPNAWHDAGADPFGTYPTGGADDAASGNDDTAVVRPFDDAEPKSSAADDATTKLIDDNPRRQWRNDETVAFAPTPQDDATTTIDGTQVLGAGPMNEVPADDGATGTAVMPVTPVTPADATVPQILPPTSRPPNATAVYPPEPAVQPASQPPLRPPTPYAEPLQPLDLLNRRIGTYRRRGRLAIRVLTAPLALLAACLPCVALIVVAVIAWLLLTAGCNARAQFARESRHHGERHGADGVIRVASLPWHMVRSLPGAVLRTVVPAALLALGTAVGVFVLQRPMVLLRLLWGPVWGSWAVAVPILIERPLSLSGLALGMAMALGWAMVAFGDHAETMRLGAGALAGAGRSAALLDNEATAPTRTPPNERRTDESKAHPSDSKVRGWAWPVAMLLLCAALAVTIVTGQAIEWSPLTMIFA